MSGHIRQVAGAWVIVVFCSATGLGAAEPIDFNRDIRPILADKCLTCHGPDPAKRQAELRLDLRERAIASLPSGTIAIVPGKPDASELVRRIEASEDERMPPTSFNKSLTSEEKTALTRWIAQGADYAGHWSFERVHRPSPPSVTRREWVRNEIDRFILVRLEKEGLRPSVEADRPTLIRRLHLDLLGLPPTVEQVDAFVRDHRPDAYERLVDSILSSPRFGEKMAQQWLDLARFGDTNGFHYDSTRTMWLWRDYVIASFNSNKPFDRFTIEQLAGDLLPNPTQEQLIASGFNRNTRFNEEGGADPAEFVIRYAVDRTNTLGQVWMGLTLGCAECHSHKYDPISHKEYYQLFAFFNSLEEPQVSGNHGQTLPPLLKVASKKAREEIARTQARVAELEGRVKTLLAQTAYKDPVEANAPASAPREEFVWLEDGFPRGAATVGSADWRGAPTPVKSGKASLRRAGKGQHQIAFANAEQKLRADAGDRIFAHVWLDPKDPPAQIMLQFNLTGHANGWQRRVHWGPSKIRFGKKKVESTHLGNLPKAGEWVRLEFDAQQAGLGRGSVIHGLAITQFDGAAYYDAIGISSSLPQAPVDVAWIDDEPPAGAKLSADGSPGWNWVSRPQAPVFSGQRSMKRQGPGLHQHFFLDAAPLALQPGDQLFAYVWLDPKDPPSTIMLQWNDGGWDHRAYWGADKGFNAGSEDSVAHRRLGDLPIKGQWVRLEVPLDKVGLTPSSKLQGMAFTQVDGTAYFDRAGVRTWAPPDERRTKSQRIWEGFASGDESVPKDVRDAVQKAVDKRSPSEKALVRDYFVRYVWSGSREAFGSLNKELAATSKSLADLEAAVPHTLISKEMEKPRDAFVLIRGDFQQPGEKVARDVPAVFPRMHPRLEKNRLGLAKWLMSPDHPLTARVAVNRFWSQFFGVGLVKSLGDFGSQGEYPSHPELLDWLADEFVSSGWDVKRILKTMVTSATYRQSSAGTSPEHDPYNRLLSRMPRFRLSAEEIRDNALAVAGLLSDQVGGPSVMPYQPADFYKGKNENWPWTISQGPDLYRRGLYTFWRRTSPYPSFAIFDAPSREECSVCRPRTNTPLQALVTLNDPSYIEAARVLAQRTLLEPVKDDHERLEILFKKTLARSPSPAERLVLEKLWREQRARFESRSGDAAELAKIGSYPRPDKLNPIDHAAWTTVANAILNLDETITRE